MPCWYLFEFSGEETSVRRGLIAITGWGQEDDRRKSREAGFNEHLTSPDSEPLIGLIARSKRQSQCGAVPPKAQDMQSILERARSWRSWRCRPE
jgi:hypothetical protein